MRLPHPTRHTLGRALFSLGARAYDTLTAQPLWRRQIARLLDLHPPRTPERVLDLGTGPGVSAFVLAEHLPAGSHVTGLDLAPQMIARAHTQAAAMPHLRVDFLVADATALPFPDAAFDRVTGHSFLYLLPDAPAVMREVARVLRPGGVATFMEPSSDGALLRALGAAETPLEHLRHDPSATLRFATSMALWRLMSATQGRLSPSRVEALFSGAGLEPVLTVETLGGLGLHCVGRRTVLD